MGNLNFNSNSDLVKDLEHAYFIAKMTSENLKLLGQEGENLRITMIESLMLPSRTNEQIKTKISRIYEQIERRTLAKTYYVYRNAKKLLDGLIDGTHVVLKKDDLKIQCELQIKLFNELGISYKYQKYSNSTELFLTCNAIVKVYEKIITYTKT